MNYEIVTDSAANLPEELIEEYGISILSLSFIVDEQEFYGYEKGKTIDLTQFYSMMRDKKDIRTSLVNVEDAITLCDGILEKGKDLLYIGFSSGLSGTYQSVLLAIEELRVKYPERKIMAVDTLAAALGEGLLVRYGIQLREEGKSMEEVYQWVLDNRLKLCHWITVDDLFFLKRGGRVSATAAVVGTALSIKPVLFMDEEGKLKVVEKIRGRKKSLDTLVSHLEESITNPEEQRVYISHGDCLEDAQYVAAKIREKFSVKEILIRVLDPVIGAHSGPGTVAVFYLGIKR